MSLSDDDIRTLRIKTQAQKVYLAVENPPTVWTGRVSGAHSVGAELITFTSASQIEAPLEHCTLLVGSTAGASDVGIVRYRSKTSSVMKVGFNHLEWESGQYLTLIKQIRPWSLLPSVDGQREDQDLPYTNQNTQVEPIARIGSSAVCVFRDIDGYARVKFYSNSSAVTGSIVSHAWTAEHATPALSAQAGTLVSPIEFRFDRCGQHWVTYTVTDTNGKTATRYCIVYVFDRSGPNAPYKNGPRDSRVGQRAFELETCSTNYDDGGWILQLRSLGLADWLEGSQIVLFNEQFWGGRQVNIDDRQWQYRENLMFVGWIKARRIEETPDYTAVNIQAYGPVGWLQIAESWPINLKYSGSGWHSLGVSMTADRAALHILQEHSTLCLLSDVNLTGDTKSLLFVDCQESMMYEQINFQIYDCLKARLISDHLGRLIAERNQQLIPVASRNAGYTLLMSPEDWRDKLDLGEGIDYSRVCQIDFAGFYYNGADPKRYYSLAPARELSTGTPEPVTGTRVDSQNEANILSGLHLAWANNQYNDVGMPAAGYLPLDIIPSQRILITMSPTENNGGLNWNQKAFWIRSVSHSAQGAAILTDFRLEAESDGPPGVTNYIPEDVPPEYPDYEFDFDIPVEPQPFPEPDDNPGDGTTCYVATELRVARTTNFLDSSPSWLSLGSFSGLTDLILDPWDPKNTAIVCAGSTAYITHNLADASPTWSTFLTITQVNAYLGISNTAGDQLSAVKGNITQEGLFYFSYVHTNFPGNGSSYVVKTTNYGTISSVTLVLGTNGNQTVNLSLALEVGQHNANVIFRAAPSSAGNEARLFRSINGNASYSQILGGFVHIWDIHSPYNDNPNDDIIYVVGMVSNDTSGYRVYKTINGGSNWTDITPSGYVPNGYGGKRFVIHSYTQDRNIMFVTNGNDFWTSTDGGDNWTQQTDANSVSGEPNGYRAFGGFPYNGGRIQCGVQIPNGTAGLLMLSLDNGVTWQNRQGNWTTGVGSYGSTVGTGVKIVVPLWVA
jgi:hypothetical protein